MSGFAAAEASKQNVPVNAVDISELRKELKRQNAILEK